MRFVVRLVAVGAVCAAVGIVGAPVAGAADTQPPTAPSNVRVLAVKPDTVTIAFTGSTDDVGLKWYVARVEGVRTQATTSPSGTEIGGLKSDTTYTLTVVAVDKAGNVSAPSAPVTATTAKWTPPTNFRVTTASGGTVSVAWNESANMPQAYRYLVYDGGRPEVMTGINAATMQRLAPGTHTFTVRAMHSSGDVSPASSPVTVTVAPRGSDQTAPTAPQNVFVRENPDVYDFVTTWDPSTDDVDPAPAYDVLQEATAGGLFVIRYAVSGTTYRGRFSSAVRAVDQAGNRSAPTPSTFVW
jgi:predicted phage tail protein